MKIFLAEIRIKNNVTIRELAKRSGIATSYIQRIEGGEANPTIGVMCKLAKALGVNVCELFSCDC